LPTKIKRRQKHKPLPIPQKTLEALQAVYAGARFLDQGDSDRAEKEWTRAVAVDPGCTLAWSMLTDLLEKAKRPKETFEALSRWIATCDRTAENLLILGNRSCALQAYEQGIRLVKEALQLDPSLKIQTGITVAQAEYLLGNWENAIQAANEVLEADPNNLAALRVRFHCWFCLAWVPEEVADSRRYIEIQPDMERHSRLLFTINYLAETTPEAVYEESLAWSKIYAEPVEAADMLPHKNTPDPGRRLKIGYISPDLRMHAIMKLVPAVFEKHDQENFEIFAYSVDTVPDDFTEYARRTSQNFVDLPLCRKAIAERVRADGIDILVDLAGHTMKTDAYLAFAMKPAPIQVSWLGALSTTGLKSMDYFLGDAHMPCPGTEHLFSETVYRLPRTVCCYRPPGDPGVGIPPYFANGYITFGSFNDPRKITPDVAKVWAILLHLHPDAKLMLKYQSLEKEIAQRHILQWFAEYGIATERILFEGRSEALEYLGRYGAIDIALDPFPYNGGTTTLDTLWMGVPIVSLSGRLAVNSGGASLLSAVGLPVAQTVDEYVAIANQLVQRMPATPNIRKQLREAMQKSELMDEVGMVRALEDAYREMWRTWCATQASAEPRNG